MRSPSYAENLDTLIALITQMAVGRYTLRTPAGLSKDLSIDESRILAVLDAHKGLFRRSSQLSNGQPQYALHLRYARQWTERDGMEEKPLPIDSSDLTALLNFVSDRASQEGGRTETNWANITALLVAGIAVLGIIADKVLDTVLAAGTANPVP